MAGKEDGNITMIVWGFFDSSMYMLYNAQIHLKSIF